MTALTNEDLTVRGDRAVSHWMPVENNTGPGGTGRRFRHRAASRNYTPSLNAHTRGSVVVVAEV